jgi:glycosyltransferase involved in cell wall biosynthesis
MSFSNRSFNNVRIPDSIDQIELIFIINSPYPNYAGGIENWLYNISHRVKDKFKVTIVSIHNDEYPNLYNVENGKISYLRVKTFSSYKIIQKLIRSYLVLLDIKMASWMMSRRLTRHFSNPTNFYYIIALDTMYCISAGLSLKQRFPNSKLIASSRGPHAEIYGKNYSLLKHFFLNFEKKMLLKADQIWANGEDTIFELKEKGFDASLMLNGVDFNKFNNAIKSTDFNYIFNSLPSVVNVSTIIPIKGINELLDAAAYIINELNIKINFVFIGKGDSQYFIEYAKSKQIFEFVFFLGHKSNVCEIIKSASIATCLSGGSGLSMAAIESLASGIPTIAWDSPVYRQFNKDQNYLKLVTPKDHIALGLAIVEVIKNYDYYLNIAKDAKDYARKFDWDLVTQSFITKLLNDNSISN